MAAASSRRNRACGSGTALCGAATPDVSTLFFNPAARRLDQGEFQMGLHAILRRTNFRIAVRVTISGTPFVDRCCGTMVGNAGVNHIIGNMYFSQPVL
jgi:hypothetical protein